MGENVRLMHDIVEYANSLGLSGAVVSIDQQKAFDRVDWTFMLKILDKFGFGPSFKSFVSLVYSQVLSGVQVNGFLTELFPITRGVRQGCPLSPLLYVIVAESLACAIRADPCIRGFPLPGGRKNVKLSQYADDTSTFARDGPTLDATFALFDRYERASGAKLNPGKSTGLLLGSWRDVIPSDVPVRWSKTEITTLGTTLTNDGNTNAVERQIQKFRTTLNSWRHRQLTLRGRTTIINTLGFSLFIYLASLVHVPDKAITMINRVAFTFLWRDSTEWVSRSSATQSIQKGGLGVLHFLHKLQSLRTMWIKRFVTGPDHPWKYFFRHWLRRAFLAEPVELAFELQMLNTSTLNRLPKFYRSVIIAWLKVGKYSHQSRSITTSDGQTILLENFSTAAAYRFIQSANEVPHRCVEKYQHLNITWQECWSKLELLRYDRPVRDTNWLISHASLPTSDRLIRFGVNASRTCHCGQVETLQHLLLTCPLAVFLFNWLATKTSRTFSVSERYFCVGDHPPGIIAIAAIIRHYIWLERNSHHYNNKVPVPACTLVKVVKTFRFVTKIIKKKSKNSYYIKWLADGALSPLLRGEIF